MGTYRLSTGYTFDFPPKEPVNPFGLRLEIQDDEQEVLADLLNDYLTLHGTEAVQTDSDGNVIHTWQIVAQERYDRSALEREADLDRALQFVGEWKDEILAKQSIWLYRKNRGEAPKRSLLLGYTKQPAITGSYSQFGENRRARFSLALTRHKYWESLAVLTQTREDVSLAAGMIDLSTFIPGNSAPPTAPSRISEFLLEPFTNDVQETWIGIKPFGEGVSEFDPIIPVENGAAATGLPSGKNTDTTIDQTATAGGSTGNVNITDFSTTPEMMPRWTVSLLGAFPTATHYEHWIGRYRVLLRYRVTSATAVLGLALRVKNGGAGYAGGETLPPTYRSHTNTNWQVADLGAANLPPAGYRRFVANSYSIKEATFELHAELLSGSGNLECDVLYLVPARYAFHLNAFYNSGAELHMVTHEDDAVNGYVNFTGLTAVIDAHDPDIDEMWAYPPNSPGGVIVVVAQRDTGHVLADTADISISVVRRWVDKHG